MITSWWHIDGAPTPEEWVALLTALTLAAAVVAAVIALVQLRAHFVTERARSRPYVIVDFAFKSILMQVEIKNIGATAASDVVLRVDPPFESGLSDQATTLNTVFSHPEQISMLAPGRRILYTFDRAPDYHTDKRPERYKVTATYTDLPLQFRRPWRRGWRREVVRYTDTYVLDFRQWSQASAESDYDNMNWNIAKREEADIRRIAKSLGSIADAVKGRTQPADDRLGLEVVVQSELTRDYGIEHPADLLPEESGSADAPAPEDEPTGPEHPAGEASAPQVHNPGSAAETDEAPEPASSA